MAKVLPFFLFLLFAVLAGFAFWHFLLLSGLRLSIIACFCAAAIFATDRFSMKRYEKELKRMHTRYDAPAKTVAFTCPECERAYNAPESLAGKTFICRSCKSSFTVVPVLHVIPAPTSD